MGVLARTTRIAAALGVLLATARAVPAQGESRQQKAEKLAQAGELLFDAGKYEDALRQFLDAYEQFEPPGFVIPEVLWNIARCYEETGDDLAALRYFEEFRKVATAPEYREAVEKRLEQVRARLAAEVSVEVSPPTASAWLDGKPLAMEAGRTLLRLDPGLHVLRAQAPGHREQERSFRVEPRGRSTERMELSPITGMLEVTPSRPDWQGAVRVLVDGQEVFSGELPCRVEVPCGWRTVRLEAQGLPEAQMEALEVPESGRAAVTLRLPEPPAPAARQAASESQEPPPPTAAVPPKADPRRQAAWATLGTGIGLAVLGAGGLGLGAWDRSRITSAATAPDGTVTGISGAEAQRLADRARTWDIAGGVVLGVGGAAILTGTILLLTKPQARHSRGPEPVIVAGVLGPRSAWLAAHLRW